MMMHIDSFDIVLFPPPSPTMEGGGGRGRGGHLSDWKVDFSSSDSYFLAPTSDAMTGDSSAADCPPSAPEHFSLQQKNFFFPDKKLSKKRKKLKAS